MLIFFLLGLLAFPSRLPQVVIPALLIAVFLTFVARPVAVALVLTPFKGKISQQLLVSWAGLRGAASIVFAIMAEMAVETENDVFHIVFMIVLFSILLQGSLLPLVAKKLDMIDEKGDVMKTFNDYSDEVPVQFIQLSIPKSHHWCGKTLKELTLPPETLVVLLKRNGENIIPNGNTRLLENDVLAQAQLRRIMSRVYHLSRFMWMKTVSINRKIVIRDSKEREYVSDHDPAEEGRSLSRTDISG